MKSNKLFSRLLAKSLLITSSVSCLSCCVSAMELTVEGKFEQDLENIILTMFSEKCKELSDFNSAYSKEWPNTVRRRIDVRSIIDLLEFLLKITSGFRGSLVCYCVVKELRSYIRNSEKYNDFCNKYLDQICDDNQMLGAISDVYAKLERSNKFYRIYQLVSDSLGILLDHDVDCKSIFASVI